MATKSRVEAVAINVEESDHGVVQYLLE